MENIAYTMLGTVLTAILAVPVLHKILQVGYSDVNFI